MPVPEPMEAEKEHHFLEAYAFGNNNSEPKPDSFSRLKENLSKIVNNAVEEQ